MFDKHDSEDVGGIVRCKISKNDGLNYCSDLSTDSKRFLLMFT